MKDIDKVKDCVYKDKVQSSKDTDWTDEDNHQDKDLKLSLGVLRDRNWFRSTIVSVITDY